MNIKSLRTDFKKLVREAKNAKKNSFSPFSKFRVGAALLTADGHIVTGCNIESSSYSLTICAERTALFKAVSDRHKKFKAIAIASDSHDFTPPCGACRQVMMDLAGDIDVLLTNRHDSVKVMKLSQLLPLAFTKENLLK